MRENIGLFKAKRADNKKWVEGYYLNFSNNHFIFIESEFEYTNDIGTLDGQAIKIDHKTLSQYTNLKDKNGKLIFEGDILKCGIGGSTTLKEYYIGCVNWIKDRGRFEITTKNENSKIGLLSRKCKYCEIIGNKFEEVESE